MFSFDHILCPVDSSDASMRALVHAAAFASRHGSRLTVLHVVPVFDEDSQRYFRIAGLRRRDYTRVRDEVVGDLRRALSSLGPIGVTPTVLVEEGRVDETIVSAAASLSADLLVIGTHGRRGFNRLLLGSVTERVLRTAPCPVLTVPPAAAAPAVVKNILCPIDYSPSALKALDYALELAGQVKGRVTVLNALEYVDPEEPCEHVDSEIRHHRRRLLVHTRERLHAQLTTVSRSGCDVDEVIVIARAYKAILERAAAVATDLIVMGAQGAGGVELMLYGSNTQYVVRAATCPVLTVRAPAPPGRP